MLPNIYTLICWQAYFKQKHRRCCNKLIIYVNTYIGVQVGQVLSMFVNLGKFNGDRRNVWKSNQIKSSDSKTKKICILN